MAKKTVATLKSGKGNEYARVIQMKKSKKTGAYFFRDEIVNSEHVKDFFAGKKR